MSSANQEEIALQFNERINDHDIDGLAKLMTDDHVFIDTGDNKLRGKEKVLEAWKAFFVSFPDYRNLVEKVISRDDVVTLIGRSICSDERLDGPAIWTARIIDNRVAEWRVYEDVPETRRLLGM